MLTIGGDADDAILNATPESFWGLMTQRILTLFPMSFLPICVDCSYQTHGHPATIFSLMPIFLVVCIVLAVPGHDLSWMVIGFSVFLLFY